MAKRDDVVTYLLGLSDGDLLDVLQHVFARRTPNPEEAAYNRNAYFLGTASQLRDDNDDNVDIDADPQLQRWGEWHIEAVAYIDHAHYPLRLADDCGFCQFGTCMVCKTNVRSYAKHGICPIW